MATAWGVEETDVRRVTCVRHPKTAEQLYFCLVICSHVICDDCRADGFERGDHQSHQIDPLQEVLTLRKERLASIRKLIDDGDGHYVQKHDTTRAALHSLETEQKTRINEMNRIIDDFTSQLFGEVENMIAEAKAAIANRISEIWSANPAETRRQQIYKELVTMRQVRTTVKHEVRLCDRDELYLVEKNRDLESFAGELSEFQKKTFEMPDEFCYQLADLRRELKDRMSQLHRELKRTKDAFLNGLREPFPIAHADRLFLQSNNVFTVPKEKLVLPNDTDKSPTIIGVIPADDDAKAIYFADGDNSKIKLLCLQTSQLKEVDTRTINLKLIMMVYWKFVEFQLFVYFYIDWHALISLNIVIK